MKPLNRRWVETAIWLWLGCTAVYFLTAPGRIDIIDGGIRFEVTRSLMDVGRPIVRDPYLTAVAGRDGRRYSFYPLGASITALPFVEIANWLGHGSLEVEQFAFSLTTVPFAAAACALLFLIWGRLGFSMSAALFWALVVAFGTPLWPYAGSSFDTAIQAFWLLLALWAAIEAIDSGSLWWSVVSGAAFACLVNVQEMYAVLGASILFAGFRIDVETIKARLQTRAGVIISAGLLAGVGAVLAFNAYKFGSVFDTGRTAVPHPLLGLPPVGLAGLFVSPAKSIFLYSPTYLFALVGLRRLVRADPRWAPLVICLALHILLTASLRFWAGEWAWGPRYLIASLPVACVGLPFVDGRGLRRAVLVAAAAGVGVQLLAISVDHQRYYFERSLAPYFWVDERSMYTDSPLFARPAELLAVLEHRDLEQVRALVPSPTPRLMTSSLYGPPPSLLPVAPRWMRQFLVFLVPRPWPLWSAYLSPEERPGPTGLLTLLALAAAATAFGLLSWRMPRPSRRPLQDEEVVQPELEARVTVQSKPVRREN